MAQSKPKPTARTSSKRKPVARKRKQAKRASRIQDLEIELHGNMLSYRRGGEGPPMVLLHGIASNNRTWDPVIEQLAETHTVIAPDLIGHGRSAKPMGDYSVGGYASIVRDLLLALEIERFTLVGHSLGGGIAMQLLHMAPELVGRIVLVDSGGLGRGLGMALRAASLPGAPLFLRTVASPPIQSTGRVAARVLRGAGLRLPTDVVEGFAGIASLHDSGARQAFLNTVHASTSLGGQRVSAVDKLYLLDGCPALIIWGEKDTIIPVEHAYEAQELVPEMTLAIVAGAGHFPHIDAPEHFIALIHDFEEATESSTITLESLGETMRDATPEPTPDPDPIEPVAT